jgi:periplasmic copper chaperone A
MKKIIFIIFISLIFSKNVFSDNNLDKIKISDPYLLLTMPNPKMLGGYFTINNMNDFDIKLISVKSDIAKKIEIHKTEINNEKMKMIKIKDGIAIGSKANLELKHGSYHLMIMGITEKINLLEEYEIELIFSNLGSKKVFFKTKNME